jgi:hypothetical protein
MSYNIGLHFFFFLSFSCYNRWGGPDTTLTMQRWAVLTLLVAPANGFSVQPAQRSVSAACVPRAAGQTREPLSRYGAVEEAHDESACQLSLQHRETLRKEGEQRRRLKSLATAFVARGSTEGTVDGESGAAVAWGAESLAAISALLDQHELVEVRGVALGNIKQAPEACRLLVEALRELHQARDEEDNWAEEEEAGDAAMETAEGDEEGEEEDGDDEEAAVEEYDGLAQSMLQVQLLKRKVCKNSATGSWPGHIRPSLQHLVSGSCNPLVLEL